MSDALDQTPPVVQAPRASFMGLPVELRLLIYGFVPEVVSVRNTITSLSLGEFSTEYETFHCAMGGKHRWSGKRIITNMAILAVNKQIFAEAMPVVYQSIEICPSMDGGLPFYAKVHVQKVSALCQVQPSKRWLSYSIPKAKWEKSRSLKSLWYPLRAMYPNVRQLRVHLCREDFRPMSKFDSFHGALSGVTSIILGLKTFFIGYHTEISLLDQEPNGYRTDVVPEVRLLALEAGDRVKVVEECLDAKSCIICASGVCCSEASSTSGEDGFFLLFG